MVVDGRVPHPAPRKVTAPPLTSFFGGMSSHRKIVQPKKFVEEGGADFVSFTQDEVTALSAPFAYTLIGKFSKGVPTIADIAPAL